MYFCCNNTTTTIKDSNDQKEKIIKKDKKHECVCTWYSNFERSSSSKWYRSCDEELVEKEKTRGRTGVWIINATCMNMSSFQMCILACSTLLLFRDSSVYAIKVLISTGKCMMQLCSIPFRFFFLFLPLIFPLSWLLFIYFYSLSLCIPAAPFLICMRVIAYNQIFVHTAADCFAHNNTNDTHPNNNNLITKHTIQNHVVLPSFS